MSFDSCLRWRSAEYWLGWWWGVRILLMKKYHIFCQWLTTIDQCNERQNARASLWRIKYSLNNNRWLYTDHFNSMCHYSQSGDDPYWSVLPISNLFCFFMGMSTEAVNILIIVIITFVFSTVWANLLLIRSADLPLTAVASNDSKL